MKAFTVFIAIATAAIIGLSVSSPVEAKRGHNKHDRYERHYDRDDRYEYGDRYARHGRSYIAARDIIYVHGIPYHRYHRIPVYVERNRYGHPISYYVMQEYRDYNHHDDYRYRDDRDGITIVYRNR
jgi:hypothetical protein